MVYEHFRGDWANKESFNYNVVAPADYYDWRAQTHGFEDMAAWRWWQFNLTGERGELPESVTAAAGSWNLFPLLGVQPAYGRTFAESEDHPDSNVAMLTWSTFERRFAAIRSIVGRQIHLDGKPYTVVGVLPKTFRLSRCHGSAVGSLSGCGYSRSAAASRLSRKPCDCAATARCEPRHRHQPGGGGAVSRSSAVSQRAGGGRCCAASHDRRSGEGCEEAADHC